ncbi:hypothetical protein EE612_057642 [Oryza sativa]|nr:hypothetical protein EE612_057642 [Oryza sativa]
MPSTTTAPETDPSKTVVEEITGWLRLYSDGTVERLTPPGAEPFTVIVPPYTEPRNGVTVHDVTTARGVDARLYLPAEPATAHRPRRRPLLLHFHGGGFCLSSPSWALYHNFYAPLLRRSSTSPASSPSSSPLRPSTASLPPLTLAMPRFSGCGTSLAARTRTTTAPPTTLIRRWNAYVTRPTSRACSSSATAPAATSCTSSRHTRRRRMTARGLISTQ